MKLDLAFQMWIMRSRLPTESWFTSASWVPAQKYWFSACFTNPWARQHLSSQSDRHGSDKQLLIMTKHNNHIEENNKTSQSGIHPNTHATTYNDKLVWQLQRNLFRSFSFSGGFFKMFNRNMKNRSNKNNNDYVVTQQRELNWK